MRNRIYVLPVMVATWYWFRLAEHFSEMLHVVTNCCPYCYCRQTSSRQLAHFNIMKALFVLLSPYLFLSKKQWVPSIVRYVWPLGSLYRSDSGLSKSGFRALVTDWAGIVWLVYKDRPECYWDSWSHSKRAVTDCTKEGLILVHCFPPFHLLSGLDTYEPPS